MKLYGYPTSPFVVKVMYALESKGVSYEHDEIFPWGERERLNKLNPAGKVPVLEVDGKLIAESNDILAKLDEMFPDAPPLFPKDPASKAATYEHLKWVESQFPAAIGPPLVFQRIIKPYYAKEEPDAAVVSAALANIATLYEDVEAKIPATGFLAGDKVTAADATMWVWMRGAEVGGAKIDSAKCPRLAAWYERMLADDVCGRTNRLISAKGAVKEAIAKKF